MFFQMEIITAVLSGDRCLEVRLFANATVSVRLEQKLTRRLCQVMDRKLHASQRWYRSSTAGVSHNTAILIVQFKFVCLLSIRSNTIYVEDDLTLAPCYEELDRISQSCSLKLKMVDCLQSRYIDLYCIPW